LKLPKALVKFLREYCDETPDDVEEVLYMIEEIRKRIKEDLDLTNWPEIVRAIEEVRDEFEKEISRKLELYLNPGEDYICSSHIMSTIEDAMSSLETIERKYGLVKVQEEKKPRYVDDDVEDTAWTIV
jgi:hypothetical protein